jgi:hypothetical protein
LLWCAVLVGHQPEEDQTRRSRCPLGGTLTAGSRGDPARQNDLESAGLVSVNQNVVGFGGGVVPLGPKNRHE